MLRFGSDGPEEYVGDVLFSPVGPGEDPRYGGDVEGIRHEVGKVRLVGALLRVGV